MKRIMSIAVFAFTVVRIVQKARKGKPTATTQSTSLHAKELDPTQAG
jgi:hypothetical protein